MATARLIPAADSRPSVQGTARVDRRTKNLVKRLRPGDIAVIDHADLDGLAASALAEAHVSAVLNARPFITGKYPNRGPSVLAAAGIPLYQLTEPEAMERLRDGDPLTIGSDGTLYRRNQRIADLEVWDTQKVSAAMEIARANLDAELTKFARNTLEYLEADKDLLLQPVEIPTITKAKITGRHALIVVRGDGYKEDLALLRPYLRDMHPALIAVDGGADALLALGFRPDIILGDMDSISDAALRCGAQLIVHAYRAGDPRGRESAPGMIRIQELGLHAETFAIPGTSEDAALLLAYEKGADLIVAVGTHSSLEDFLDKGRSGMASTFLVRLKIGPRLVDARGVFKLYQPKPPGWLFGALLLSALCPPFVLLLHSPSPLLQNMVETVRLWCRLHLHRAW